MSSPRVQLDLSWNLLGGHHHDGSGSTRTSGSSGQPHELQGAAAAASHGRAPASSSSSSSLPTGSGGGLGPLLHALAGHPRLLHVSLEHCGVSRGDMAALVRLVSGRAPLLACLHLAEDGDAVCHADLAAAILAPPSEEEAAEPAEAAAAAAALSLSLLLPPSASEAAGGVHGSWVPVQVQAEAPKTAVAVDMPTTTGGFAKAVSSLLAASSGTGSGGGSSGTSGRVILSRLCGHLHLEGSERWRLAGACWLCDRWSERGFTYTAPEASPSVETVAAAGGHTWVSGCGALTAGEPSRAVCSLPASSRQALSGRRVSVLAPLAAAAAGLAQSRAASLSVLPVHHPPGHVAQAAADSPPHLGLSSADTAAAERVFLATSLDGWLLHEMRGTSPLMIRVGEGVEEGNGGSITGSPGRGGSGSSRSMTSVESDRDVWQAEGGDVAGLLRSAEPPPLPLLHRRWAVSALLPPSSRHAGLQLLAPSPPCFFVFLRLSRSSARVVVDASQACAAWGRPLSLDCSALSASTAAELRGSSREGRPPARLVVLGRVPLVNVLTAGAAAAPSSSAPASAAGGYGATHTTAAAGGGGHHTADLFELALLASVRWCRGREREDRQGSDWRRLSSPLPSQKHLVRRVRWRVEESVFAGLRQPAGGAAAQRAFDADYSRVRMDRITAAAAGTRGGGGGDAASGGGGGWRSSASLVGATLLAHWPLLCEVFKAAAALSAAPNLAYGATQGLSVSWKEFSRFAAGIGAVDPPESGSSGGGGCRGSDIDTIFIVVNAGGGGAAAVAAASAAARGGAAEPSAAMDDDVRG